jgi:hypothetical protein
MASPIPLLLLLAAAPAAPAPLPSDEAPAAVRLPRLAEAPAIDCVLDEATWRQAAVLRGFVQTRPGTNIPPSRETEVRLGYTATALYVAIRAGDDPARVRATVARRDAIQDDDTVALYLDTFHDRRRAYLVMVNPVGVQQDGVFVEGQAPDWSVDLLLESRGCLTETGYAVELAIPFESLRYEAGPGHAWGLHVLREIKHLDEEASWMPLRRDRVGVDRTSTAEVRARFLGQAGTLLGLEDLPRRPVVELTPVGTLSHGSSGGAGGEVGLTAKAALTPSLAADLAVNPDFAEVEADQPQVTGNVRFPLFFEEKRPFFLEGAEVLQTPIRVFHSRTVIDPVAALKLTGRRGRTALAALTAADAAPVEGRHAAVGALRARRDVGDRSSLGLIATTSSVAGRHNQVFGVDGQLALGRSLDANFQALGTTADTGRGFAYHADAARTSSRLAVQASGEGFSPGYRADLGYTTRTDTHRWSLFTRYNAPPPSSGPLVSWSLLNTGLAQFDWQGRMQYAYLYPRLVLNLRRQSYVHLSAYRDYLRVFEEEFGPGRSPGHPGTFAGRPERSTVYGGVTLEAGTAPSRAFSLRALLDRSWNNLDYDLGAGSRFPRVSPGALIDPHAPQDPGPADSSYAYGAVVYQPAEALRLTLQYERQRLRRQDTDRLVFDQGLTSFRGQYALSRFGWVRGRIDHDSLEGRLLAQLTLGWTPRPGTALYAGYDETGFWQGRRLSRTFFVKASWSGRFRPGGGPGAAARDLGAGT